VDAMNTPHALSSRNNGTRGRSGDRLHTGATQQIMLELLAEVRAHHPAGEAAAIASANERGYHASRRQYEQEYRSWHARETHAYQQEMAEYQAQMSQPTEFSGHYRASNVVPKSKYAGTERSRRL
jgi:hypothetical protein